MADGRGVVCLGAGAIGCLLGARLFAAGARVALVGRGEHLEAIRKNGLVLEEAMDGGNRAPAASIRLPVFPSLAEAVEAAGEPRAIIMTVKTFDVPEAATQVAHFLGSVAPAPESMTEVRGPAGPGPGPLARQTLVVCLGNGVGAEEAAARFLPEDRLVAAAITLSVERPSPGRIRLATTHGGIALGPVRPFSNPGGLLELVRTLASAGFRVRLYPRGDAVKWSKLLLNLWANAISTAFNVTPEEIVRDRRLFHLDWLAFREALAVMGLLDIPAVDLPGYPARLLARLGRILPEDFFRLSLGSRVAGGRGGKMPSLWLDVAAGRTRTEVGCLNGAVVEAARRLGLSAPVNALLEAAVEMRASRFGRG